MLEYRNNRGKAKKEFPASNLCTAGIKTLLDFGIKFNNKYSSYLIDYLLKQWENGVPILYVYSSLGWDMDENELAFKFNYMYTKEAVYENVLYRGDYNFKPSGFLKTWQEMVIKEVCGNTPMEFVLAAGFASPVLARLDETCNLGAMLINLSNTTTKGKTTAAMLAASIFGNPKIGCSTMLSYNATKNALPETIAKFNGITVAIDEAAILKARGLSKLLYALCSGSTKSRIKSSKGDISLGKVNHFSNVIISTAEFDLLNANSDGGLRVRVFEINDTFTTSAKNSNRIKKVISHNYGQAGIEFINHLLDNHGTDMEQGHSAIIEELKKAITEKTDITDRLIERFAVILLATKYCNDCKSFGFTLNYKALFDYTVNLIQDIDRKQNYEERIRDIILEDYTMNEYAYFPYEKRNLPMYTGGKIRGYVDSKGDYNFFYIMPSILKQLMNNEGVFEVNKILSRLRASGTLLTEGEDHLMKRVNFKNKPRISMYCFRFKEGE